MFNFKALFTATLLTATVNTAWGKAEAVLYANSNCTGCHSGTIGMSTGVCHSLAFDCSGVSVYANSVQFFTDGVDELYYFYPEDNCGGPASQTDSASVCINTTGYKSFKKAA